jgi:hypothetical protein
MATRPCGKPLPAILAKEDHSEGMGYLETLPRRS